MPPAPLPKASPAPCGPKLPPSRVWSERNRRLGTSFSTGWRGGTRLREGPRRGPLRRPPSPRSRRGRPVRLGRSRRLRRRTIPACRGRTSRRPRPSPAVLVRRLSQIGLVTLAGASSSKRSSNPASASSAHRATSGVWDGFRAGAEDAPSAAALRLQQLNRLVQRERDLEDVAARADGARQAHEALQARLAGLATADQR